MEFSVLGWLLLFLLLKVDGKLPARVSTEKNLIREILGRFTRAHRRSRPVDDFKKQVSVHYGLQLFQILSLDANTQTLETNCWSMYTWKDPRLMWEPAEYRNITIVRIHPDSIWTPDIQLLNYADTRLRDHRIASVVVSHTGETLWVPQARFKSTCQVELSYFPFDTQTCMLNFSSSNYDKTEMDILFWIPGDNPNEQMQYVDFSDYVETPEWTADGELYTDNNLLDRPRQIKSLKVYQNRTFNDGSREYTREFPMLCYRISMKRNAGIYVFMLVVPSMLLSALTLVSFWLPPESPAKLLLGASIFLAMFLLLDVLALMTPTGLNDFPLIGIYLSSSMLMIVCSLAMASLVVNIYFHGDRFGTVPRLARRLVIDGLGKILMVRQGIQLQETSENKDKKKKMDAKIAKQGNYIDNKAGKKQTNQPSSNKQLSNSQQSVPCLCQNHAPPLPTTNRRQVSRSPGQPTNQRPYWFNVDFDDDEDGEIDELFSPANTALLDETSGLEQEIREARNYLHLFIQKKKSMARKNIRSMEWRCFALVLDRLFFLIYIATLAIIVLAKFPKK